MRIYRSSFFYADWLSFFLVMLIAGIGLALIFSATHSPAHPYSIFFKKQALGICLGAILYWVFSFINAHTLLRWGYFSYAGVIILLLFTLIKGSIGMGAQRWLQLFFIKLQPSELAKPLFPAFVSYYLFTHQSMDRSKLRVLLPLAGILALSFLLIMKQPDLGTALVIGISGLLLLWLAGVPKKLFLYGALLCALTAPALWYVLKPYQRNRIAVFLGQGTTQKERYHIDQATIAVGSGGLRGKGFLEGTQNKLQFLPESRTDFIFAVLCEEWGFLGAFFLLVLYGLLSWRTIMLILAIDKPYLQLLAFGLFFHIILSAIINVGMVLGLLPIVGIPLPFMSYGLSNLLISFLSMGWIHGIYLQTR